MRWECHVEKFTEGWYDIILGRDLLTALGLYLKISEQVIEGGDRPYKSFTAPMVDMCNYEDTI